MAYNVTATRDQSPYQGEYTQKADSVLFEYDTPLEHKWCIERMPKRLTPQNNSYRAKGNNLILIDIPNDHVYNFKNSMLYFTSILSGAGGTYIRQQQGSWNLFSRIRHLANNKLVEEIVDYGDVYDLHWVFEGDQQVETSLGTDLLGIETQANRNAWGANPAGTTFAVPITLGFLTAGLFPAKFMKERHQLEITIQDPLISLESDKAGLDVVITDIRWTCDAIKDGNCKLNNFGKSYDPTGFEANIKSYVESGNFRVQYPCTDIFQNNVFSVNHDLVISQRANAVTEMLTVHRDDNNRANPLVNDRGMTYPKLALASYQWKLNGAYFPDIPVDTTGDGINGYHYYIQWANKWEFSGFDTDLPQEPNVDLEEFNLDAFIMVADLRPSHERKFIGVISTNDYNVDPQINVKYSVPPPAGFVAVHFIRYSAIASLDPITTKVNIEY